MCLPCSRAYLELSEALEVGGPSPTSVYATMRTIFGNGCASGKGLDNRGLTCNVQRILRKRSFSGKNNGAMAFKCPTFIVPVSLFCDHSSIWATLHKFWAWLGLFIPGYHLVRGKFNFQTI